MLTCLQEEEEAELNKSDEIPKSTDESNGLEENKTDNHTKGSADSTPTDTPPVSSPLTHEPSTSSTTTTTTTNSHTPNGTADNAQPTITVDPAEGTPPNIAVIPPPSPVVSRAGNGSGGDGNSGEVGDDVVVPPLKIVSIDKTTSKDPARGNGNSDEKIVDDDSDEDTSLMDSPNASPRLTSLGMLTVSSVPNFNYFSHPNNPNNPPTAIPKSGSSSLRIANPNLSPNLTPPLNKRSNRSASFTYVNLDPLCGNPHIPFFKNNDGGIPGATFVPLETNKSNEIYYIGLIDFLQKYNKKKKLAGFAKSLKYEKEELSTVDPVFYMERFLKMTERAIVE